MKAYIELLENGSKPFYKHEGDAGMDIRAAEDVILKPQETKIIRTGIKIAVPSGVYIAVNPRSGISSNTPLRISNTPGTIDSKYRDEIGVIIQNTSLPFYFDENKELKWYDEEYDIDTTGNKSGIYVIKKGDRIAQLLFGKYITAEFEEVDDIKSISGNRGGGFGSSGTK